MDANPAGQILERHLVADRRLAERDIDQLESVQTLGASLRLVARADSQQQQPTGKCGPPAAGPGGARSGSQFA